MRWLYQLFFLREGFGSDFPYESEAVMYPEPLLAARFQQLVGYLVLELFDDVFYIAEHGGRMVRLRTKDALIARVQVLQTGNKTNIVVRLNPHFNKYKVWFQLAFMGKALHFMELSLHEAKVQALLPRR